MTTIKKVMVTLGSFVLAAITLSFGTVFAEDSNYWKTKEYTNISEFRKEDSYTAPVLDETGGEDYIFAGWYSDPACTKEKALKANVKSGSAYAKFVPKKILGLKAQVNAELCDAVETNDEEGAIRFVTSVDSEAYAKVGFYIQVADGTEKEKSSNQVYKTLRVKIGEGESAQNTDYNPAAAFGPASQSFKTWTITSITAKDYGTKFTVTPFWKTLDGTIVRATESSIRTINNGRNWSWAYVNGNTGSDTTGAGTKASPYKTLEKTLSEMQTNMKFQTDNGITEITPGMKGKVYVGSDLAISKAMNISQDITLVSETPVTITRVASMTNGSMFNVTGKALHIQGSAVNGIVLDGNIPTGTRAVMVRSGAACTMEHVTVQNFVVKSGGAAVRVENGGNVKVTNCEFIKNKDMATGGGAVYIIEGGNVESCDCTFQENSSVQNGGAVHCKGIYKDTNSSYIGNQAKHGGAVFIIANGNATMSATTGKFSANKAEVKGSAIHIQTEDQNRNAKASVTGYTFEETDSQTVQVYGTLTFDNLPGVVLAPAEKGKLIMMSNAGAAQTKILAADFPVGRQMLFKADTMTEPVYQQVLKDIPVLSDIEGQDYFMDTSGVLHGNVASIGDTHYGSLADAVRDAIVQGKTGTEPDIVIRVYHSSILSTTLGTITKNVTILNEPGKRVLIERSTDNLLCTVGKAGKLTLGTNEETEPGELIVAAETENVAAKRMVDNYGVFVLGKNAAIMYANGSAKGSALVNRGTAKLYGSFQYNTCTGDGGVILQQEGELTIFDGTYSGNQATREKAGTTNAGRGGVIYVEKGTVNICGGIFKENSAKGLGGVLFTNQSVAIVNVSGGAFENNSAGDGASRAFYVKGSTNINTIEGGTNTASFVATAPQQTIYVMEGGTLNHSGVDVSLLKGKGTITPQP